MAITNHQVLKRIKDINKKYDKSGIKVRAEQDEKNGAWMIAVGTGNNRGNLNFLADNVGASAFLRGVEAAIKK